MPNNPAISTATPAAIRAASNSCFSLIPGMMLLLSKSWEIEVEITSNSPAAVESAAARPPAAINAITQPGRPAISGLANTMMSLST
ncbi:hypothetical protein D3C80_1566690 [compost metagenome]